MNADVAAWDFTGENTVATSAAEVFSGNLDSSNLLTRGANATASAGGNSFRTVGFKNEGISTGNTDFFQFTLSATTGYSLSLSSLDARFAGTAGFRASPGVSAQFAYSLDGSTFSLIGSPFFLTADTFMPQISLGGIPALQSVDAATTVTFRYYASGQTTTGGWGFNSPSAGSYGLAVGGQLLPVGSVTETWTGTGTGGTLVDGGAGKFGAPYANSLTNAAAFVGTGETVTVSGTVQAGALDFQADGYLLQAGTVELGLGTVTVAAGSATIDAGLSGSAGINKLGAGLLALGGTNTFTGNVQISNGSLSVATDASLGDAANDVVLGGGALATTANLTLGPARDISGSGALSVAPGTTLTITGNISTTNLTISGTGTLDLHGAGRNLGALTFSAAGTLTSNGTVTLTGINAAGLGGGTATISAPVSLGATNRTVDVGAGGTVALGGSISSTGSARLLKVGSGILQLDGDNSTLVGVRIGAPGTTDGGEVSVSTDTALGSGDLQHNFGTLTAVGDPKTFANGLSTGGRESSPAVFAGSDMTFNGATSLFATAGQQSRINVNNTTTFAGTMNATIASGLTVGGSGTAVFAGDGTGVTLGTTLADTVTVAINGPWGAGVTVGSGATLTGVGTIAGNVSVAGTHAVGNSVGTQTINAGVSYLATSVFDFELVNNSDATPGVDFDQLTLGATGNLTITAGATMGLVFDADGSTVDWSDSFWDSARTFTIIDLTGGIADGNFALSPASTWFDSTGTLLSDARPLGQFTVSSGTGDVVLTYAVVPEPAPAALLGFGTALMLCTLRRKRHLQA